MTEQQRYDVIEQHDDFEVRRYPEHLVAEVRIRAAFEAAGNQAFRSLAGYINGQNESRRSVEMTAPVLQQAAAPEKVAMTAPVVQTESDAGDYVIAFVLPASLTTETAPVPTNPEVHVRTVPERVAAAVRYSGRWSETNYQKHLSDLESALASAGFATTGPPSLARFDPPFKPWFLRRNEIVLGVTRSDAA